MGMPIPPFPDDSTPNRAGGACRTKVLDGTVDHRDTLLTDPSHLALDLSS
jgi:hypothetical protein